MNFAEILPGSCRIGTPIHNEDGFYEALAQVLTFNGNPHSIKSLRILCAKYLCQLSEASPDNNWVRTALEKARCDEDYWAHVSTIQFTQEEMTAWKKKGISTGVAIGGKPSIEGRILAGELKINLHLIEYAEEKENGIKPSPLHHLITKEGVKTVEEATISYQDPQLLHLAVYRNQFVPIFNSHCNEEMTITEAVGGEREPLMPERPNDRAKEQEHPEEPLSCFAVKQLPLLPQTPGLTLEAAVVGPGAEIAPGGKIENVKVSAIKVSLPEGADDKSVEVVRALIKDVQLHPQGVNIKAYGMAGADEKKLSSKIEGSLTCSSATGYDLAIEQAPSLLPREIESKMNAEANISLLHPSVTIAFSGPVGAINAPVTVIGQYFAIQTVSAGQAWTLAWEKLIAAVKKRYVTDDAAISNFADKRPIEACYINLALIKEEREKARQQLGNDAKQERRESWLNSYEALHAVKTPVTPEKLFEADQVSNLDSCKRALILGRAGSGKSVLCQYLAYCWAKEDLWVDAPFKLVLRIPLRQLANEHVYPKQQEITLGKIIYELYQDYLPPFGKAEPGLVMAALTELLQAHEYEILYVLDGFDEVANLCSSQTQAGRIIERLMSKERLLMTSRPYYIDNYLTFGNKKISLDRRLENMGFIDEDIPQYVKGYFEKDVEQGAALNELMNQNANLKGIAHIPINLALICRHWQTLAPPQRASFNPTMTGLYEALVTNLLYEHLGKKSGKGYIDFKNKTRRGILENKAVQPVFEFLERLAFIQMQDTSLIIKKERIDGLLGADQCFDEILGAGLLVSADEKEVEAEERREHYFIHLTFQEFFAARYLARLYREEQENKRVVDLLEGKNTDQELGLQSLNDFMAAHKYELRYEIIWWFVAGHLKAQATGLERFFGGLQAEPLDLSQSYELLLWIKCLEECELRTEQKDALTNTIKARTEWLLIPENYVSCLSYSRLWFDYLFTSPRVFESLAILQNQVTLKAASNVLQYQANLPPIISTLR